MSKSKGDLKKFSVGDRVSWKSQAAGSETKKTGTVVEVVPAGRVPKKVSSTATRKHESYVVEVTYPAYRSRSAVKKLVQPAPQLYWPLVKNLRVVRYGGVDPKQAVSAVADEIATRPADQHRSAGAEAMHADDCPQGGPPRDGEPCCDAVVEVNRTTTDGDVQSYDLPVDPGARTGDIDGDVVGMN